MRSALLVVIAALTAGLLVALGCVGGDAPSRSDEPSLPDSATVVDEEAGPSSDAAADAGVDAPADATTVLPCKTPSATPVTIGTADGGFNGVSVFRTDAQKIRIVTEKAFESGFFHYQLDPSSGAPSVETKITNVGTVLKSREMPSGKIAVMTADPVVNAAEPFEVALHEIDAAGNDTRTTLTAFGSGYIDGMILPLGATETWFAVSKPSATENVNDIVIGRLKDGVLSVVPVVDTVAAGPGQGGSRFRDAARAGGRVYLFDDRNPTLMRSGVGTYYWDLPEDPALAVTTTAKKMTATSKASVEFAARGAPTSGLQLVAADVEAMGSAATDVMRSGTTTSLSPIDTSTLPPAFDFQWGVDLSWEPGRTRGRIFYDGDFLWMGEARRNGGNGLALYWYDVAAQVMRANTYKLYGARSEIGAVSAVFESKPSATAANIDVVWVEKKQNLYYARIRCER